MAFEGNEMAQMAMNSVGAKSALEAESGDFPRAGNSLWYYRNFADDDATAANFFDVFAESMVSGDLVWVIEGGDTVTGGTLYTCTVAGDPLEVTLIALAPAGP